ncbi:MAG TPA: YggT family protein [Nitrospinota bacterium]|nr:YggT family protein [Nitrospinota bacterium]
MFIVGNFITALAHILDIALNLYMWVIIIRALMSWVNPDPHNPIVQFLIRSTEPVLAPIRRYIPITGIDISPIIAIFAIIFLRSAVIQSLVQLGYQLR